MTNAHTLYYVILCRNAGSQYYYRALFSDTVANSSP